MDRERSFPNSGLLIGGDALTASLIAATRDVFDVQTVRRLDAQPPRIGATPSELPGGVELRGRLWMAPELAYDVVSERFRGLGHIALFRKFAADDVIIAMPGALPSAPARYGLSAFLFFLTTLSVLWTGATYAGEPNPLNLVAGWPYALGLLGILLAHEMGHFIVARRLGVPASPPYFLPFPFSVLGTLGAFIQMKGPPRDRRALLAVAAAGPLAGFLVAVPVLIVGLMLSEIQPIPPSGVFLQEGNSILYLGLKLLLFGRMLPDGGIDVFLHPVALAGWAGLLVTGLNLIPAGQLDGGHIAYALLGERSKWLKWGVVAVLLVLSLQWEGWLLWAGLIILFGWRQAVPLDDLTRLRAPEIALCLLLAIVFMLVFTPVPLIING